MRLIVLVKSDNRVSRKAIISKKNRKFLIKKNVFISPEGDECVTNSYDGTCLVEKQCPHLEATMTRKGLLARDVGHCGYTVYEEIICCP